MNAIRLAGNRAGFPASHEGGIDRDSGLVILVRIDGLEVAVDLTGGEVRVRASRCPDQDDSRQCDQPNSSHRTSRFCSLDSSPNHAVLLLAIALSASIQGFLRFFTQPMKSSYIRRTAVSCPLAGPRSPWRISGARGISAVALPFD